MAIRTKPERVMVGWEWDSRDASVHSLPIHVLVGGREADGVSRTDWGNPCLLEMRPVVES